MKITIELDDNDIRQNAPSFQPKVDNGWEGGIDVCATCPNRPGGPLNKSGFCNCAIPSMYGPFRITA